jgi:hypothetical protein
MLTQHINFGIEELGQENAEGKQLLFQLFLGLIKEL